MRRKITFVSTMNLAPWGGSEALWSQAALCLLKEGHDVAASVTGWPERAIQVSDLIRAGVWVWERSTAPPGHRANFASKATAAIGRSRSLRAFSRWLHQGRYDLICISCGSPTDDIDVIERCCRSGSPYAIIVQANAEYLWPDDEDAKRRIEVFRGACRVFFVCEANWRLLETQLGVDLPNGEVVCNPFNVSWSAAPPWPGDGAPVRLACVARLDPPAKGQDLLLQVLATEPWRSRPVTLSFFGKGPKAESLHRLVGKLGLDARVRFMGHESNVERIWETHHALVLPSRFEGLPLAILEAMLCGRLVIVTHVAGNADFVSEGVTGFVADAPTARHMEQALERAWARRQDWEGMGREAARAIRSAIPADPSAQFAERLKRILDAPT